MKPQFRQISNSPTTLYCFSPLVMIITCTIELVLAGYALLRYRRTSVGKLVVLLLVLLAVFQMAEYVICGGLPKNAELWARIGFAATALMPPLLIHLIAWIGRKKHTIILATAYGLAAAFISYFGLAPDILHSVCAGNYIIFSLSPNIGWAYAAYYYALILVALTLATQHIEDAQHAATQKALRWLIAGVLTFLVPTAVINALRPETIAGLPSILCGFAVLFALVLGLKVLPLATSAK